jgi:hypothetical protein
MLRVIRSPIFLLISIDSSIQGIQAMCGKVKYAYVFKNNNTEVKVNSTFIGVNGTKLYANVEKLMQIISVLFRVATQKPVSNRTLP